MPDNETVEERARDPFAIAGDRKGLRLFLVELIVDSAAPVMRGG